MDMEVAVAEVNAIVTRVTPRCHQPAFAMHISVAGLRVIMVVLAWPVYACVPWASWEASAQRSIFATAKHATGMETVSCTRVQLDAIAMT